ncbi:MAG: hypothetical protein GY862_34720 [Gammaproteobacteria bacterium]|nr:hypothetical protein [Gammaproteobacteria bacterium]
MKPWPWRANAAFKAPGARQFGPGRFGEALALARRRGFGPAHDFIGLGWMSLDLPGWPQGLGGFILFK